MSIDKNTETLEGTVTRVVFNNSDNGWTVIRLQRSDNNQEETATGTLENIAVNTPVTLHGNWEENKRFGKQFRTISYMTHTPKTEIGIEAYLGSGLLPGIGRELAKRIVQIFGTKTVDILNKDPYRLLEVSGLGKKKVDRIAKTWKENHSIHDAMVFLQGHGISNTYALNIYKKYRDKTMAVIKNDPYQLIQDIIGIGFRIADTIAQQVGIEKDAPERLQAGLVYMLRQSQTQGHLYLPKEELKQHSAALLAVDITSLDEPLDVLERNHQMIKEKLIDHGYCYYMPELHQAETYSAEHLAMLVNHPPSLYPSDVDQHIKAFEQSRHIALAKEQRRAMKAVSRDNCIVITGGPGVGKTTTIRGMLHILSKQHKTVCLAAPTGRAAKKLEEATGHPAQTLHRLLEFQPRQNMFLRNADMPLEVDTAIIDEASMLDIRLFSSLISALPSDAQLILVGDIDQLPSIGAGSVLKDIIQSDVATVIKLIQIFRQAQTSNIVVNAHKINQGELPDLSPKTVSPEQDTTQDGDSDFFFIERSEAKTAQQTIVDLVSDRIPTRFNFDPLNDIQVLCPIHRGEAGTMALNLELQKRLTPIDNHDLSITRGELSFRVGDKVMQTRNNHDKNIFNGNIGVIRYIDKKSKAVSIEFQDQQQHNYTLEELDQIIHAYAISIHKSQGTEYPAVVIPLLNQHYIMLQRNLLYTAITRGKALVILVGSTSAVLRAVKNNDTQKRYTWLEHRLRDALDNNTL